MVTTRSRAGTARGAGRAAGRRRRSGRPARPTPETRRADLLDAAERCFAERGYHETTVDAIAARAGVSKGAFYWHFESKRDVFTALVDRALERAEPAWRSLSSSANAESALRALSELALAETERTLALVPASLEYLAEARRDQALTRRMREYLRLGREIVAAQVRRGIADGAFREVDPQALGAAILAAGDALGIHRMFDPDLDVAGAWRALMDALLRGLAR
jgi:AcrR family transcriptional regulator